jgi:hypothetical protein
MTRPGERNRLRRFCAVPRVKNESREPDGLERCIVTAIAPDGRRSTIEVEAKSRNYAAIHYNYRPTSDHTLIRPDFSTLFEITLEGGEMLRVT